MTRQSDNPPLPLAEVIEVLKQRTVLTRRGGLTPWDRVAARVTHSKATCLKCEKWFKAQPFEQVERAFPEDVLRLHPDYLKRRIVDIGPSWALHYEEVRVAASQWAGMSETNDEALARIWNGRFGGWGLTWMAEAPVQLGQSQAQSILRGHLVPPVVPDSFWGHIDRLLSLGTAYVQMAKEARRLAYAAIKGRDLHLLGNVAHAERGVTHDFARTLWGTAMALESEGEYETWGLEWHGTGGMVVTTAGEAHSLRAGMGWSPGMRTVHHPGGGFPHPPDENARHIYGSTELPPFAGYVFFGLSYNDRLIAVGMPEEIEEARKCHGELISAYQQHARMAQRKRAELDSLWERVAARLRAASQWQRFPGSCPKCPSTPMSPSA